MSGRAVWSAGTESVSPGRGKGRTGLTAWTPRELRHSLVSPLRSTGLSIEDISHLVGHANTCVTESVYRKELWPVLTLGAAAYGCAGPRFNGHAWYADW
jgi:hypothetical protein